MITFVSSVLTVLIIPIVFCVCVLGELMKLTSKSCHKNGSRWGGRKR